MKAKAKPVKGSARTKKFDRGGTVAALAGLGTLAYLLNKKKKGEEGGKGMGKFPMEAGDGTSGPGMDEYKPKDDAAKQRAMAASMGRPDMGGGDKAVMESDKDAKRTGVTTPAPAAKKKKVTGSQGSATTAKQGKVSTTGVDAGIAAGNQKKSDKPVAPTLKPGESRTVGEGTLRPYPAAEAAKKKAADKEAAIKKGSTFKGRSANPIAGTFESSGKSMARTPAQTMSERAREVQRRREEAEKSRYKKGGAVKKYAAGGSVKASSMGSVRTAKPSMGSASKRGDGIAMRGKTRGKVM